MFLRPQRVSSPSSFQICQITQDKVAHPFLKQHEMALEEAQTAALMHDKLMKFHDNAANLTLSKVGGNYMAGISFRCRKLRVRHARQLGGNYMAEIILTTVFD